jgi:hypothetical protein
VSARQSPGIIDSLSTGFGFVVRRPYFVLVPILVDVLVWKAPAVTAGPLVERLGGRILDIASASVASPDDLLGLNTQVTAFVDAIGNWNLVGVLGWQVPTFFGVGAGGAGGVSLSSMASIVLLLFALALLGVLVGCAFLMPLAWLARGEQIDVPQLFQDLPRVWMRLAGYLGLLVLIGVVVGGLALLLFGLTTMFSPALASLVLLAALVVGILAFVYLFLGDEAVVVGGASPVRAIRESVAIARAHLWSVVGFFIISMVISQGLDLIWRRLAATEAGTWASLICSAAIATGLAASVMVYYWGRRPLVSVTKLPQEQNPGLTMGTRDE